MTFKKGTPMPDLPSDLLYNSIFGWGFIAATIVFAMARSRISMGPAVMAAAAAALATKSILLDLV